MKNERFGCSAQPFSLLLHDSAFSSRSPPRLHLHTVRPPPPPPPSVSTQRRRRHSHRLPLTTRRSSATPCSRPPVSRRHQHPLLSSRRPRLTSLGPSLLRRKKPPEAGTRASSSSVCR